MVQLHGYTSRYIYLRLQYIGCLIPWTYCHLYQLFYIPLAIAFLAYTTKELLRTFERKRGYRKLSHVANDPK